MNEATHMDGARRLPFFVYGTLKPGESNYAAYLEGRCLAIHSAQMRNAALFSDGTYAYLIVDSRAVPPDDIAYGVLSRSRLSTTRKHWSASTGWRTTNQIVPGVCYDRITGMAETSDGPVEVWTYVGGPQSLPAIRAGRLVYIPGGIWNGAVAK